MFLFGVSILIVNKKKNFILGIYLMRFKDIIVVLIFFLGKKFCFGFLFRVFFLFLYLMWIFDNFFMF